MKRNLLCSLFILSSLFGCSSTYNKTEYNYLTNLSNYKPYSVKYHYDSLIDNEVSLIYVSFLTLDELNSFRTTPLENVSSLDNYPTSFTIHKDNKEILNKNLFYNDIKKDEILTIYASNYVYQNNRYHFIVSIEYNNKTYLSTEEGIKGITNYLNEHKSPFFN